MNPGPTPTGPEEQSTGTVPFIPVGAILTGGASRRFGSDKALAPLTLPGPTDGTEPGGTMGGSIVSELRVALTDPVVAVGGTAGHALGVPTIPDPEPDLGPLAGLASVLGWAGRGHVVVVPCDAPRLRAIHIRLLIQAASEEEEAWRKGNKVGLPRAAIAVIDSKPQPTFGCWPALAGTVLQLAVRRGERRMMAALDHIEWLGVEIEPAALSDADDPETLRSLMSEQGNGELT